MASATQPKPKRVNVRRPEVMDRVQAEVEVHYRSAIVEKVRSGGGRLSIGSTTVLLAKEFGFCYGVERAIDLAYAARKVFEDKDIYLIGEIIHNPEVNRQLVEMGIKNVVGPDRDANIEDLGPEDVVIIPAFGTTTETMNQMAARGVQVIDTTCGDVMSVWKRVGKYANDEATSIIHGKAYHEETKATASRAMGADGKGHYLVVLNLEETDYVCDYIRQGGDRAEFLEKFQGAYSEGFDPERHLGRIGVANQTTMLKSETEEMQRRLRQAVLDRDADDPGNFQNFDTICGATQERQDALHAMLQQKLDMLIVVGGYNSSNTSQLVKIGGESIPSFFIRNSRCLKSLSEILHFDLERKEEKTTHLEILNPETQVTVGITAGASCPNNLIEETIVRIFGLRGIERAEIEKA